MLTAGVGTPAVTLSLSPTSISTIQALTVTISVSGGSKNAAPTGSVTVSSGVYTSSATTLSGGSAAIVVPAGALSIGTDSLSVSYTPDSAGAALYKSATGLGSVVVTEGTPTLIWATPAAITYGTALSSTQLNASSTIAGSFSYSPASGAVLAAGAQTLSVTFTPIDTITYHSATSTVVLTVNKAGTTASVGLSNGNLTFTSTVAAAISGVPTGSVSFYAGQTLLGTGTLSNGVASYTATAFPAGDVSLSAQYSGDANFTQSASASIPVLAVSPGSATVTVSSAGTASDALTFAVAPGYTGTLQLSCTGLPQYAACSFAPSSVVFSGSSNSATSTLTINTGGVAGLSAPSSPFGSSRTVVWAAAMGLPSLLALALARRRRKLRIVLRTLLLLFLLCGAANLVTGCGGSTGPSGGSGGQSGTPTPPGAYTVQVVTSGPSGLTQTTSLSVTVQ
jgi:hypothetical protein